MSSTESVFGEKQKVLEWAKKYHSSENEFPAKSDELDSYFEQFDSTDDVAEYGFSNLMDFKERLLKMWNDAPGRDEIALICAVAMFKSKPIVQRRDNVDTQNDEDFSIPEFIYAF